MGEVAWAAPAAPTRLWRWFWFSPPPREPCLPAIAARSGVTAWGSFPWVHLSPLLRGDTQDSSQPGKHPERRTPGMFLGIRFARLVISQRRKHGGESSQQSPSWGASRPSPALPQLWTGHGVPAVPERHLSGPSPRGTALEPALPSAAGPALPLRPEELLTWGSRVAGGRALHAWAS